MGEWGRSKLRQPSRVRLRGNRDAWDAHLAENRGKRLRPQPETEAKALAVRVQRQMENEMAAYKNKKLRRKMTRAAKARVEKRLIAPMKSDNGPFRVNKSIKHAMELLDDTFKYLKQKPPVMNTSLDEPWVPFMLDAQAKMDKWPEAVLKQFVEELTLLTPKGVAGYIKACKQIMDYTFNAPSNKTGPKYNARWKMWPHQRDRESIEAAQDDTKENLMASKLAAKKKKGVDKVKVSKGKGGKAAKGEAKERSGGLMLVRANNKLPDGSDRQKKAVSSVGKDGVLMKAHAKTHGRMIVRACIKNGFLKTKKAA